MSQLLNLQIKNVLDLLHKELVPMTPEEIGKRLNLDIVNNRELRENIESSPKLSKEPDGKWRWKSKHNFVRSKVDLMQLLRRSHNGIEKNELEDSYKGAADDIKEIIEAKPRELIVLKNSTTKKEVLFPFNPNLALEVSPDIKESWEKIIVPDLVEVHRYLVKFGLKNREAGDLPQTQVIRKRPRKQENNRRNRRVKLTNSHIEGLDLNENPVIAGGKKVSSAFKDG